MKPITLSLNGFRSYPKPVTIDFTGKGLAAALGDTGAGKSSLLDAITFALFRKSAWDASEPRQLIADNADAMSVELVFLHDGHRWQVHRTMHATNSNGGRNHLINLDTGEELDGVGPVGARLKTVLQMGYETFLRVGLLPQGRFDKLLVAPTKERTTRLRELFGTDSLADVRQIAADHSARLTGLIGQAEIKRQAMHGDPARTAADAGTAAAAAEASGARLNTAIDVITKLREEISSARFRADSATAAADRLAERTVREATEALDALEPVAARIATQRAALDLRAATAAKTETNLAAQIAAIESGGESQDTLNKAAAILDNLATRTAEHRGERQRIADRTAQLEADAEQITAAHTELAHRAVQAQPLIDAAHAAESLAADLRAHASTTRTRVTAATTAARRTAETARAHRTAVDTHTVQIQTVGDLKRKNDSAAEGIATVEAKLDALKLRDQAAAIAADLSPGDDCPVCHQHLPATFEPAFEATAAEARGAKTLLRQAKTAHEKIAAELAQARASVTLSEAAVPKHADTVRTAHLEAQKVSDAVQQDFADLAALAARVGGSFDTETAWVALTAAMTASAEHTDEPGAELETITSPLLSAITTCEQAAADYVGRRHAEALDHTARIEADRKTLGVREDTNQEDKRATRDASQRLAKAVAVTETQIRALPDRIRALMPDEVVEIGLDDVTAAAAAVADRLSEVRGISEAREAARAENTAVLTARNALDRETHTQVQTPLTKLREALDGWAHAADNAITYLDSGIRHRVPEPPGRSGITEIREFAAELTEVTSALDAELIDAHIAYGFHADTAVARLTEQSAALADVDGFDDRADLMEPNALHPLVEAKTKAGKEAEHWRTEQRTAQQQVRPAADLDFAITAGRARLEALEVLRRELVEARFLGHLTAWSTRALLGIASELLGQLTDETFGFADNFEIVSRGSGVVHHANRLSGGEKFLASLALALALAELHSYSGPRLGSLFLDEGFATLDRAALEAALDVLRARAGNDRLVMVISHLHAVAEAVDDVLWVEREPTGSTARWLTATERDELIHADLASGLQDLA
ncbi:SMC family ATPase [Nocardia sp. NPDC005978]|uniref:SMC family ATPase n=1 Tax=Nocardia sp. NPDC005978 TaxID=3156725 RepID=UPI0033AFD0CA